MFEFLALLCIATALILLVILSIIDLKILILPDELNFALAVTGLVFHFVTTNRFLDYDQAFYGALVGAGLLYVIRFFSNRHHGRDTLGLGDVKLLGAAGIWLGVDGVLLAITAGAFAGLLHGLAYAGWVAHKNHSKFTINNLAIPAGPGFAVGIVISGALMFAPFIGKILHDFVS